MNVRIGILVLATLAVVLAPNLAPAQSAVESQVRDLIEQNGDLLEQATVLVQETNSPRARTSLVAAERLHEQSLALLNQGAMGMAGRVALRTRQVIRQTIAIAKRDASTEEQAGKAIDRASIRLEQARGAVDDSGSDDNTIRGLVQDATNNLHSAQDQMQQRMFETALRLADQSTSLSMRALRLLHRAPAGAGDVLDEVERTDLVLERLGEVRPGMAPALADLADQATEMQRRARHSAGQGDAALAREQTLSARNLALRVLRAAGPGGADVTESAGRAVAVTGEILDRARELARENGDAGVVARVEEAARVQETARRALDAREFDHAVQLTTRARDMVRDALTAGGPVLDPAVVENALARTDEVVARLQTALEGRTDDDARAVLRRAQARQEGARRALTDGDLRRALALTKVANSLARDGLRRLGDAHL